MIQFNDLRILIIDDADTIRTYLKNVFESKGAVNIDGAATGQEGIAKVATGEYHLILVDLFLPDTDGIEVLKQIRTINETSTIVMVTGHGGINSAIAAVQLGADGYIEKQNITSTIRDHVAFIYALEQAIEHRAGILAQKQLEQVRSDVYAMVTHDLRSPTGLILTAVDMLINENSVELIPDQLWLVQIIQNAANRLLNLINSYLDYAKIDAGFLHLELEEANLVELITSSEDFVRLQTASKKQHYVDDLPSEPIIAVVDVERVKHVLENLLSNAIKYTPEGGTVTLQLRSDGEQAVFSVSDTGIGISATELPQLFTKYHRIQNEATRTIKGTGLGLHIVREIVEAHHGTIQAISDGIPGNGTTFIVSLPLRQPHVALASQPESPRVIPEDDDPREIYQLFWDETSNHIRSLRETIPELHVRPDDQVLLKQVLHIAHTLNGNSGTMGFVALQNLAEKMETILRDALNGTFLLTNERLGELSSLLTSVVKVVENEQQTI